MVRFDGIVITTDKDAARIKFAEDNVFALGVEMRDYAGSVDP